MTLWDLQLFVKPDRYYIQMLIAATVFAHLAMQEPTSDLGGKLEVTVPAKRVGNYFFVKGKIKGQELNLVVDSGAGLCVLTQKSAAKLNIVGGIPVQASGIGKNATPARIVTVPELNLNGALIKNEQFVVIDLPEILQCDGLVGYSFLKHFATTFDYDKNELRVADAKLFKPAAGAAASELKIHSNHPNVKATIGGKSGWVVLDTGNNSSGTVLKWLSDEQGLAKKWKSLPPTIVGRGVGGFVSGQPAITPAFDFAGVEAPSGNITLDLSGVGAFADKEIMANIGAEYLRRFIFTLDYPNKKAYFSKSKAFGAPFKFNRAGLRADFIDGTTKVVSLMSGGAAELAGVKVGEEVLAINGKPITEIHPLEISEPFNLTAGTKVTLKLRSKEGEREVSFVLIDLFKS